MTITSKPMFIDRGFPLCYKKCVFAVLLLLTLSLAAKRDYNLIILPQQAVKVGDKQYQLMKSFDTSIKQIKRKLYGRPDIRSDILINEDSYRVYAFYNLSPSAKWHRMYIIGRDGKVWARIFK